MYIVVCFNLESSTCTLYCLAEDSAVLSDTKKPYMDKKVGFHELGNYQLINPQYKCMCLQEKVGNLAGWRFARPKYSCDLTYSLNKSLVLTNSNKASTFCNNTYGSHESSREV